MWDDAVQGLRLRSTPGYRRSPLRGSKGIEPLRSVPQILLVELDPVLAQERPELVLERQAPVVFLLVRDVGLDHLQPGVTHRERPVPGLPREARVRRVCVVDPPRRPRLQLAKERGQGRLLPEGDEQVHVVGGAPDQHGYAPLPADDAAEVLPQAWPHLEGNDRAAVLGAKDEVVMQAGVRLPHGAPGPYGWHGVMFESGASVPEVTTWGYRLLAAPEGRPRVARGGASRRRAQPLESQRHNQCSPGGATDGSEGGSEPKASAPPGIRAQCHAAPEGRPTVARGGASRRRAQPLGRRRPQCHAAPEGRPTVARGGASRRRAQPLEVGPNEIAMQPRRGDRR